MDSDGGKRMYRTSDGKIVEMPPDMTVGEAAEIQAEAKAAESRMGKGPPPKPVPDVKQLAKKEGKTEKPEAKVEVKKVGEWKGNAAPRVGGAVSALLKGVGPGKVVQYLAAKGAPVPAKGVGQLQKLKENEQTHDGAAEKLQRSERAVIIPASEGQSQSNTGQVNMESGKPTPAADEHKTKQKLQDSRKEHIPQSIEDVDNLKRDKNDQHMGADVMKVVQGDKNAVVSTFPDLDNTPAPAAPEHRPETLSPEAIAPPTPNMNLGQGAIATLQKEHTDASNYTKEADRKLKEEGVTQERIDTVDSADLAAANKQKKGMAKTAKSEPPTVQKLAQQEADQKADKAMRMPNAEPVKEEKALPQAASPAKTPAAPPDRNETAEGSPGEKEEAPGMEQSAIEPAKAPAKPEEDPDFQEAKQSIRNDARKQKSHEPVEQKQLEMQAAAALTKEEEQMEQSGVEQKGAALEEAAQPKRNSTGSPSSKSSKPKSRKNCRKTRRTPRNSPKAASSTKPSRSSGRPLAKKKGR